ncbi:MAG: 4Fe-4S cluster-binding domain-containing protein [Candidatus Aminicenantes bacterium]|nr:4Fe-4S cluster-binding domain-containing protein [Candidatus Aminicenantes bacterium]NIM80883.1 4Fe-4S cluster-binding domain-containing protein [Candidatus Aminicenantes bacterium]NIN20267.1 4Fe-4S cluster-binding domain-containing protein [Candidatus Aminicenantes bacterium]NIN44046.1 4Fe-4S cluster-binding domain-containing protein [Candidatus Aminicenantes bacterium]NIN86856.1 4Fe-4S cluster-binding domain-containing protein [Candidatus Aminicenantes bacterium]
MREKELNIAVRLEKSVVNGPGTRYVIWVQGCPFRCAGCFNKEFQASIKKEIFEIEVLAKKILAVDGIEGVTYTGGEPMTQAEGLYHLSRILKKNGLTIACYTGFTLEELNDHDDPYIKKLLSLLDILIDGKYEEDKKTNLMWRGSSNQRIYFLSDAYSQQDFKELADEKEYSEMELVIGKEGIAFTGILEEKILRSLRASSTSRSSRLKKNEIET